MSKVETTNVSEKRKQHLEKVRLYSKIYYAMNKDKINEKAKKKYETDANFRNMKKDYSKIRYIQNKVLKGHQQKTLAK